MGAEEYMNVVTGRPYLTTGTRLKSKKTLRQLSAHVNEKIRVSLGPKLLCLDHICAGTCDG